MFEDPHFFPAPLDHAVRGVAREIMAENYDKGAGFNPALPILHWPTMYGIIAAGRHAEGQ